MTFNHYVILISAIAALACVVYYTLHIISTRKQIPPDAERGSTRSRIPPSAFRPLAILFVLVTVIVAAEPLSTFYKGAIVLGLSLALIADLLYIVPGTPLLVHLGHLVVIYALYAAAFASQMRLQVPSLWGILLILLAGGLYYLFHSGLTFLRVFTLLHMGLIFIMAWTALEMLVQTTSFSALLALVGVLLFIAADSVQAVDTFRQPLCHAKSTAAGTYLIAQLLIGLSVAVGPHLTQNITQLFTS